MDAYKIQTALADYLKPTPLVLSHSLSEKSGKRVWLKLEIFQPTHSFKIRPAFWGILNNLELAKSRGVIASSSGNFAQAVAYAAKILGVKSEIIMMESTSSVKIERTKHFGAKVTLCAPTFKDRMETFARRAEETGSLKLFPYDSVETIEANSALALELLTQLSTPFSVICPVSGGGLISRISQALSEHRSSCEIFAAQPEFNASLHDSLIAGKRIEIKPQLSIADALVAPIPGALTFPLIQKHVKACFLASEDEIAAAVKHLLWEEKIMAEPGGAVSIAALLKTYQTTFSNEDIVCIVSGGNVAPEKLLKLI